MNVESAAAVGSSQIKTHSSLGFSNKEIRDDLQEPLPRIGPGGKQIAAGAEGKCNKRERWPERELEEGGAKEGFLFLQRACWLTGGAILERLNQGTEGLGEGGCPRTEKRSLNMAIQLGGQVRACAGLWGLKAAAHSPLKPA